MAEDKFGITMLYATDSSKAQYVMSDNPNSDAQFEGGVSGNPSDGWTTGDGNDRLNIWPTGNYPRPNTLNHSTWAQRGYASTPQDWRDIEFTMECRMNGSGDGRSSLFSRGGKHNDGIACEGFKYTVGIYVTDGEIHVKKETYHVHYDTLSTKSHGKGSLSGKWIRYKYVTYNINNNQHVKIEGWFDFDCNNNWVKLLDEVDNGRGSGGSKCDSADDAPGVWEGPDATIRWDDLSSFRFRKVSVRSITPTGVPTNPDNPGEGGTEPPDTEIPEDPTGGLYSKDFDILYNVNFTSESPCSIGVPIEPRELVQVYNVSGDSYYDLAISKDIVGVGVTSENSIIFGKVPRKVVVILKKLGAPAGTIKCWQTLPDRGVRQQIGSEFNVATLLNTDGKIEFENQANTEKLQVNASVYIEATGITGSDINNVVKIKISTSDSYDSSRTILVFKDTFGGESVGAESMDFSGEIWE